jgi:hypothetical protein
VNCCVIARSESSEAIQSLPLSWPGLTRPSTSLFWDGKCEEVDHRDRGGDDIRYVEVTWIASSPPLLAMTGLLVVRLRRHLPRRPLSRIPRAMGGGEKVRRGGLARKEQAAVDGRGEHGALAGMAGQGM